MVVCKYYQAGRCRYGNNCKFEHIDPPGGHGGGGGNDPFSTPRKPDNRYNGNRQTEERPQWPLSVIGKDAMDQGNKFDGDLSQEEMRVLAYSLAPRGMSAEVSQREAQIMAEHQAKVDACSRGGRQSHGEANATSAFQIKDPFAGLGSGTQQPGGLGGGGFDMGGANGIPVPHQPQGFGQLLAQPASDPFGGTALPVGNAFAQNQSFSQPALVPVQNAAPAANAAQDGQFSAAQFGFARVPEAAPPPKFF